ncbi:uncharacterized protein MONBRDRAFT_11383 [Monosiga brevicollis MX1]|uniref:Uncharacterized protein n=1 Tax=Monosiga brevicollis TaxID=81824 RepID=A9V934_MONBE|nr:uncharacterized protein MONBRDRAFT_11383 [Monosiga brevicollis MX1]EDQ86060.1 predicted protein [Monosiga brevicollis MX1]|eukprot:XP_001749254.1 hypothetical protein [Monosiga brevicollis MX1]
MADTVTPSVLCVAWWVGSAVTLVCLPIAGAGLLLALAPCLPRAWLEPRINAGPLGLRRRRQPRAHAILDTTGFADWTAWARPLARSPRTTLLKQVDKSFIKNGLRVETLPANRLGWAHLQIVIAHQQRHYSTPIALLIGVFRFLICRAMPGQVDVYYATVKPSCSSQIEARSPDPTTSVVAEGPNGLHHRTAHATAPLTNAPESTGAATAADVAAAPGLSAFQERPVALGHSVVKGDTLRLMWFYCSDPRCLLWFAVLRAGVQRAIQTPGLRWVDAGPSGRPEVAELKGTYGFEVTSQWLQLCNYDGPYQPATPYDRIELHGHLKQA